MAFHIFICALSVARLGVHWKITQPCNLKSLVLYFAFVGHSTLPVIPQQGKFKLSVPSRLIKWISHKRQWAGHSHGWYCMIISEFSFLKSLLILLQIGSEWHHSFHPDTNKLKTRKSIRKPASNLKGKRDMQAF